MKVRLAKSIVSITCVNLLNRRRSVTRIVPIALDAEMPTRNASIDYYGHASGEEPSRMAMSYLQMME